MSLRARLLVLPLLAMAVVGLPIGLGLEYSLRSVLESRIEAELYRQASVAAVVLADEGLGLAMDPVADRLGQASGTRLTLIAPDGRVQGDSQVSAELLPQVEPHNDRPEVIEARAQGRGTARRHSTTVDRAMLYVATPVERDGGQWVVRSSMPLSEVEAAVWRLRLILLVAAGIGAALALYLATWLSAWLSRQFERLADATVALTDAPDLGPQAPASLELHTERLRDAVADLARERDRSRQLERVRSDFVANVSHELRTPMAVIRANAETLLDGALQDEPAARRFTEAIQRNALRMNQLIEDLLELARVEAAGEELSLRRVALAPLVRAAVEQVFGGESGGHHEVHIDVPDELAAYADPGGLEQVLVNLLQNARRYTPSGTTVRVVAHGPEPIVLSVRDDGPGIDPEHHTRIFERFYRVDKGRSRQLGGTGLGLSIARNLVQAMGGSISLRANQPTGSLFEIKLQSARSDE